MVSTIICLASNKSVVLLDEPVLGFDAIMRVEFYELRGILSGFFQIIMLNSHAILHIGICLLLSVALSLAGLVVLKRKTL